MLKTSYYRARSKAKFAESYDMCAYGALLHFVSGDYQCGLELGTMLLESYKQDGVEYSEESVSRAMVVVEAYIKLREKDVERGRHSSSGGTIGEHESASKAGSKKHDGAAKADTVSTTETLIGGMQQLKHRAIAWLQDAAGDGNGKAEFRKQMYLIAGTYTEDLTSWKGLGLALPDLIRSQNEDAVWKALKISLDQMRGHGDYYNDADILIARSMLHVLECLSLEHAKEAFFLAKGIFGRYLAICEDPIKEAATSQCVYLIVIAMVRRNEKLVKVGLKALELSEGGSRDDGLVELCKGPLASKYVPSMRGGGDLMSGLLGGLLR